MPIGEFATGMQPCLKKSDIGWDLEVDRVAHRMELYGNGCTTPVNSELTNDLRYDSILGADNNLTGLNEYTLQNDLGIIEALDELSKEYPEN